MIILNLAKTLSDEVQYSEGRPDCVSPDVIINKENTVIVPDKFKGRILKPWRIIRAVNLKADSALRLTCLNC